MAHSHCEHHAPANYDTAFAVGAALNSLFVVAEFAAGFLSRSLALTADAGHNLGDVLSLLVGWYAVRLAARRPTESRTYGMRRSTILAAVWNSMFLMLVVGAIAWEALQRLAKPVAVPGNTVMLVALAGILVNGSVALMFARGRRGDLNIRSTYQHMLSDALMAAGVVVTGLLIRATGLSILDSLASLAIASMIGLASWRTLRSSFDLAMDAVPEDVDARAVREYISSHPAIDEVTDFHIWAMSTTEAALTAHVVVPEDRGGLDVVVLAHALHDRFGIAHSTIQVDPAGGHACPLDV